MTAPLELWLPNPGRPGYEVSDQGGARSIRKFHAVRRMYARGVSARAIALECEIYLPTVYRIVERVWRGSTPVREVAMKEGLKATLPTAYPWESQVHQYAPRGVPGVGYERHYANQYDRPAPGHAVDCLLMRDVNGELVGILNHYPEDSALEKAGNFNVWVRPDRQRRGIGSALLAEAAQRWSIDFYQQRYTPQGLALVQAFQKRTESEV